VALLVLVRSGERAAGRGQGQVSLAHALERQQSVRETTQSVGRPAQDQDFEAVVSVEMDVGRRHHFRVRVVLHVHQPMGKVGLVVAVDVGEHADSRAGTALQFGLGQPAAHKVADRLGTGPAGLTEKRLESGQQLRFHRDAEPYCAGLFLVGLGVTHAAIVTPGTRAVKLDGPRLTSVPGGHILRLLMRHIRPIGPICLIPLFALAAASSAVEVTWDTIVRLTTNPASQVTGYSSQHSIAVDAAGNVHVVWLDQRNVPYQVWYRRYDAGTSTWQAETVLTSRQANCFRPGIGCDSAGNVHLAWHVESFQGTGIWAKRYNAATHYWRADTLIDSTSTSHPQQYPSVACVPGTGDATFAWYGSPDTGIFPQVFLRERHATTGWDSAVQVSEAPTDHDQVSVAAGGNGDIAVVWIGKDFGGDYFQVFCRRRVGADWQGVECVSDMPLGLNQYAPSVTFSPDGAVHAVWYGRTLNSGYYQVFHRMRGNGGWSDIDSIGGMPQYQQQHPSIASDAAGRCHTVWCSQAGGTNFQLAYGQRDTDGVWSSPATLTSLDSGDVSYPSVACDAESGIHIVWHDASSGNPDVYYLRGTMPGADVVETRPSSFVSSYVPGSTVLRCGSLSRQSRVRLFDACGRSATQLRPGVYFALASGSRRLTKIVATK